MHAEGKAEGAQAAESGGLSALKALICSTLQRVVIFL